MNYFYVFEMVNGVLFSWWNFGLVRNYDSLCWLTSLDNGWISVLFLIICNVVQLPSTIKFQLSLLQVVFQLAGAWSAATGNCLCENGPGQGFLPSDFWIGLDPKGYCRKSLDYIQMIFCFTQMIFCFSKNMLDFSRKKL